MTFRKLLVEKFFRNELNMKDLWATWFKKSRIQSLIHCGAFDGVESKIYNELKIGKRLWVDANSDLVKKLKSKFKDSKHDMVLEAALWDSDDQILQFYVASNLASSSLLRPKEHLDYVQNVTFDRICEIHTSKLDTTLNRTNFIIEKPCLLVLDLQGAELRALKGAVGTLQEIQFVYLEVSDHELYLDAPTWFNLDIFLRSQDFSLIDWSYSKSHVWGNALYAKRGLFNPYAKYLLRKKRLCLTFLSIMKESSYHRLIRAWSFFHVSK